MNADRTSESGTVRESGIELNQTWDMGRLVDLTCDYFNGMPVDMTGTLPSFRMRELDEEMEALCRVVSTEVTPREVRMCVQAGNYLETGAHLYPDWSRLPISAWNGLFVSAVVMQLPRGKDEKVTAADLDRALASLGETIHPGDAILVATGYNRLGSNDIGCDLTPHFSYDAIDWAVTRRPSILASDMASWHDGEEEPSFWPMLMRSGVLVIGSLLNVADITATRIQLIALPMKIRGACASPCRLIAVLPSRGADTD